MSTSVGSITKNLFCSTSLGARALLGVLAVSAISALEVKSAAAEDFVSPEILMLGDSQLSFGAGEVVLDFFENIKSRCEGVVDQTMLLSELQKMRTTLVGARSSSLQSWISTKGRAHGRLCKKDPTWGVNASIWGHLRKKGRPYVQIGEHKNYDFCEKGKTPIQVLFEEGYDPSLLIFNVLGNGATRWANDPTSAEMDVMKFTEQFPPHIPCVYITTLPTYTKRRNNVRYKAQENIKAAFAGGGNRCSFVSILDKETMSLIQGHNKYFRRKKNGKVKDPFHPNKHAARKVYELKQNDICEAIVKAIEPKIVASNNHSHPLIANTDTNLQTNAVVQGQFYQLLRPATHELPSIKF